MLFLIKYISVLKSKLFIVKNIFNIKETILFEIIMQETILNRTHDDNDLN